MGGLYCSYYDAIGQLTNADSSVAAQDRKYVYDAAWNLNYRTNNTTLYTFQVDTKNQLTNSNTTGTQTYDGNGNVTYSAATWNGYAYSDENQLIDWYYYDGGYNGNGSPTSGGDFRAEFVYDGRGRLRKRIEYTTSGSTWSVSTETRYLYDGMRVVQERNGSNTPQVSYTRGTDLGGSLEAAGGIGGLLARSHGYSGGNWSTHNYYHADGNGNVTYLVNSSQGLGASYKYDPFGNTITSSGTLASANVYRFSSKMFYDMGNGPRLYYYGYRFYDPSLQRWLNRDPIGERGGINLHAFVFNDPLDQADRFGLDIQFCPEADQRFKNWMKGCICELRNSDRGRELLSVVEETPGVTLCPGKGIPSTGTDRSDRTLAVIYMDPEQPNGIPKRCDVPRSERPPNNLKGCAAVLAHELGHATGAVDEDEGGRNVQINENPARRDLGLKCRRTYHGYPVGGL